ncbi:MAG TPA: MoxR family ATPase [Chloroflexota bacterium]|nr:MoxR family ATPase [Chloroflexota bacterium]
MNVPASIAEVERALRERHYVAERGLATVIFLSLRLQKPLFLEGEAGVGKTEIAKVLADLLNTDLIRLQCYEGLDVNAAVYEWNYSRQLLHIRLLEATGAHEQEALKEIFSPEFMIRRPLLQAIEDRDGPPPVLLIDEIDRADEEFEAFLLELLSDYQITVPEIGTIRAKEPPVVVITSNRTREVHDALKRRCLYHWIDYPTFQKEFQIVTTKRPEVTADLARQVCRFVEELRNQDLYKLPGVAETLDWASALSTLGAVSLNEELVVDTLGTLLKYQDDIQKIRAGNVGPLLEIARATNGEDRAR